MTLHIQKFLRTGGTLAQLHQQYAIKAKPHPTYPNLVLFKYDQIESPFSEPIVQECRGIILDKDADWAVVSRPFSKFFNHGEGLAAKIDWSTARVQEKVDGSLCVLYHYDGTWHVATSGTPDAGGEVNGFGMSFANLFWQTFDKYNVPLPPDDVKDFSIMLELTSPYNQVVVRHKEPKLTVLAVRHRVTGEYVDFGDRMSEPGAEPHIPVVRSFPLTSLDEVLKSFEHFSGAEQEGYVVVDAAGNRIKIKHPSYVALHHLRGDGFGPRRIVTLLQSNEQEEVLVHFPEFKPLFEKLQAKYEELITDLEAAYEKYKDAPTQKDYALGVKALRGSGTLFMLRAGKIKSVREGISKMRPNSLVELLGEKNEEPQE